MREPFGSANVFPSVDRLDRFLCVGCQPTGRCRVGLKFRSGSAGARVFATLEFGPEHEGAGGVAHGGSVMTAFDEICGGVVLSAGVLAVTAELDTRFLRPVPVGTRLQISAEAEERTDQGHWIISARIHLPGVDDPLATARARFVERDPQQHYGRFRAWIAENGHDETPG